MKRLALFLILIMTLFAAGCGQSTSTNNNAQQESATQEQTQNTAANNEENQADVQKNSEDNTFILLITKNNQSDVVLKKELKILPNKSILDYLNDNATVECKGGFVTSINGIASVPQSNLTSDEISKGIMGKDWFIYINGKKSSVEADGITPKKGDTVNFDFKPWTSKDLAE